MLYLCLKCEVLFVRKMKRDMRELFYSFLAMRHKNIHGPIALVLDVQYHPGFLLLHR